MNVQELPSSILLTTSSTTGSEPIKHHYYWVPQFNKLVVCNEQGKIIAHVDPLSNNIEWNTNEL